VTAGQSPIHKQSPRWQDVRAKAIDATFDADRRRAGERVALVFRWLFLIVIGAINNRVVAYQKRSLEAPVNKFRPRKERSIGSLRRLIVIEAAFLGSAVLLSGALGETQLPSVFKGHFFPLDLQETVRPGLFGSGCQ